LVTVKKILVPLDGSKHSLRALDLALALSGDKGTQITGIHVIKIPIQFSRQIKSQYQKNAEKIVLQAVKVAKKSKIKFNTKIRTNGYVGKEIVKFAEDNKFDLIVMGSRGPSPIAEMFLGSAANYVLIKSKVPVLIVK
jgi:nucleotide-binding universal stress UspA family protein